MPPTAFTPQAPNALGYYPPTSGAGGAPALPALPALPTPTGAPSSSGAASVPGVPQGLDPKAYILTKAIAYQENGGKQPSYTVKGGSGEYGAYQYLPATWNARAAKYLGANAPSLQDATPDQQNQVTYDWVADKLNTVNPNTGVNYTPAEVASMHNAGEGAPEAYKGNKGVNSSGVSYDTSAYANGVQKYAEMLYNGQDPASATAAASAAPANPAATSGISGAFAPVANAWSALSQSQPTDTPLEAGGKAALNLIPSAFNFVKGAVSALNPLQTLGNIAQIPQAFSDAVAANGGDVGKTLGYAFGAAPGAAYQAAVPEATRDLIGAGVGFAQHPDQILPTLENMGTGPGVPTQYTPGIDDNIAAASKAMTNDPFGQTAPIVFGADALAGGIDAATGAAAKAKMGNYVDNIAENTENGVPIPRGTGTDLRGAVDSTIQKIASPVTKYAFGGALGSGAEAAGATAGEAGAMEAGTAGDHPGAPVPSDKQLTAAGKIVQGKVADQATAARVLSQVSTKGVKTYADLSQALGGAIKTNLSKVDEAFNASPEPVKMKDLTQKTSSTFGDKTVTAKMNYVDSAIKGLQELYQKTSDPANAARMKAMAQKANSIGLTPGEINGLARQYGTEFGTKAFSKVTKEPLTSVNAQSYENVRSGLKDTARGLLKDKAAQALDKQTSDMIRVKGLVDKMEQNVNQLTQKITKRNIIEKLSRGGADVFNMITLGGPKAFLERIFPSNVGLKTANSIDLENQLKKNLNTISKLKNADDSTFVNGIIKAARAVNALPSAKIAPVSVFGRAQPSAASQ